MVKQKSKTTAEARKDKVEKALNEMGQKIYDDLDKGQFPSITLASRSVKNIVYDRKLAQFILGSNSVRRTAGNIKHIRPFTQLLWLAFFSRKLVDEKKTSTLRDVYYSAQAFDVEFMDQAESDELITDLEVVLGAAREEFNVFPEERSAIFGNLTVEYTVPGYEGKQLDLSSHPDGVMIGPALTTAEFANTDAEMVLAIEKGGLFTRFIEEKVHKKYKAILVNTAGQPPRSTRYLLRRLHQEMKLPIGILTDADPWGAHIAMVIKSGSANAAHLRDLTTPSGVWLGVWASVTKDEPVFVERNGYIRNEEISKIYDSVVGPTAGMLASGSIRAASCSEHGEVRVDPVGVVTKHRYHGDIFEIRTQGGYTVKTTGSHSIQIFNQSTCELESSRVDSVRKGDIVAACLRLPDRQDLTRINLAELILSECPELAGEIFVEGEEANQFSDELRARYNKKILRNHFYQVLKRGKVKLSYYQAEGKIPQSGRLRLRFSSNELPVIIDDMPDFARLLGYYAAEGGLSNGTKGGGCELTFNLEETGYVADASMCISKTLGVRARVERRGHSKRIRFGGTLLARILSLVLKAGLGAHDRQVPFVMFNVPDEAKREFLRGYFRGDRMINYNENTRLSAKTVSRKLASDLVVILKQLGCVASVWKSGDAFVVACANTESIRGLVEELCHRYVDVRSDLRSLPGQPLYSLRDSIKELAAPGKKTEVHTELFTGAGKSRVGFDRVERALQMIQMPPQDIRLRRLLSFMENGIALVPITEIRNLGKSTDFVYDLEVAETHTFLGGLGGLVLHNSDIVKYKLPSDPLTEIDIKRLYELKADPRYKEKMWHDELDTFLQIKKKSEQEAFSRYGLSYIVDTYLPAKLELMKSA